MSWLVIYEITYLIVLILICLRIIYDTQSTTKTLAYLLFAIFVPFAGMIFYFFFGINYRKKKMYSKKIFQNDEMAAELKEDLYHNSKQVFDESDAAVQGNKELAYILLKDTISPLTANNKVKLLLNGENKFPEVLAALKEAKNHIHIEYYIYEDDEIGRAIENILVQKAQEGVDVRFIYDDFGSRSIRRKLVRRLKANGVKAFPFLKVYFILFANRLNYRNHRKIIVVDGYTAFVGGINVSDRYINDGATKKLFWRDTHLRIDGPGVQYLQYLFCVIGTFVPRINYILINYFFLLKIAFRKKMIKLCRLQPVVQILKRRRFCFPYCRQLTLQRKKYLLQALILFPGKAWWMHLLLHR